MAERLTLQEALLIDEFNRPLSNVKLPNVSMTCSRLVNGKGRFNSSQAMATTQVAILGA